MGEFRHHPVETKATFALTKLAFNGIANPGILLRLTLKVGFGRSSRSPQRRPTEANPSCLAPLAVSASAIDLVCVYRFWIDPKAVFVTFDLLRQVEGFVERLPIEMVDETKALDSTDR